MSTNCREDADTLTMLQVELSVAFEDLPEVPSIEVLWLLSEAATPRVVKGLWVEGKRLQRKHGITAIPPKTELENAAGLWSLIRDAVIAAKGT